MKGFIDHDTFELVTNCMMKEPQGWRELRKTSEKHGCLIKDEDVVGTYQMQAEGKGIPEQIYEEAGCI